MCAKCLKEGQMLDFTMPKKKKKSLVTKPVSVDGSIEQNNNNMISNLSEDVKKSVEEHKTP